MIARLLAAIVSILVTATAYAVTAPVPLVSPSEAAPAPAMGAGPGLPAAGADVVAGATAETAAIAVEAYAYAYPLVLMELTRRVSTNVGSGAAMNGARAPTNLAGAPMNRFAHTRAFPDAKAAGLVRPDVDLLTSSLWFDVSREPLVVTIPDTGGRYVVVTMLDMWSDVFAAPGTRTTGGGARTYALTAPSWSGDLPAGVERIAAPTNEGLIVTRVRPKDAADLAECRALQDRLVATPLSRLGVRDDAPPPTAFDASRDMSPPAAQILRLAVGDYFALFADVTARNPPHANDWPILQRLARVGLVPGKPFDLAHAPTDVQTAFRGATMAAATRLFEGVKRAGARANGWRMLGTPMGTYGTDYLRREVVAYGGLGASVPEDAIAPATIADADGKPLDAARRYTLHFPAGALPPVHAFWSLTLYTEEQMFAANPLGRYALGTRDPLVTNADGSLDLYLQRGSPGREKEPNWLPPPAEGRFTLMLRLYWPRLEALDGTWMPPPVRASD